MKKNLHYGESVKYGKFAVITSVFNYELRRTTVCITTIFRDGDYELVKHDEGLAPYAIFKRADGFWQQVSKWYCTCGWADHKLKQLLKKSKTTEAKND